MIPKLSRIIHTEFSTHLCSVLIWPPFGYVTLWGDLSRYICFPSLILTAADRCRRIRLRYNNCCPAGLVLWEILKKLLLSAIWASCSSTLRQPASFRVVTVVGVLGHASRQKPETMKMLGSTTPWKIQILYALNLCFGVVYIYEKVALLTWWWQW